MGRAAADLLWKLWYPALTRLTRRSPITFLNYGYAETDSAATAPPLSSEDERNRPCIQLYDSVVRPIDLCGRRVLEVSCGHGGGASYIVRYCKPMLLHAVDRNAQAIKLCRLQHKVANLTFSCGNALALDFADASFDAIVNVEASHCYPDIAQFLREVLRVLRPGGHFLFADFRQRNPHSSILHEQLLGSGLELLTRQDISTNVVRGMELNTQKYMDLIARFVPRLLHKPAMRFAGVAGSPIFEELKSGQTVYERYVLRKPRDEPLTGHKSVSFQSSNGDQPPSHALKFGHCKVPTEYIDFTLAGTACRPVFW